jgi:DNA-binding transcriptional LysR family regulator
MSEADLRDLEAFAAVARHRNFRRAAVEQRISVSSLSQRIGDLEALLGVRLLNRTTRSVAPTEAGERLLARITPALRDLREAVTDVRGLGERPSGRLRINAPAPAIQHVLAPMAAPFLKRFPDIELEIIAEPALVDIVGSGYDAGMRYEEDLDQDMIAVALGPPQRYCLVASPGFLEGRPPLATPMDLVDLPLIGTAFPNGRRLAWEFEKDGRLVTITPRGPLLTQHIGLQLRAAVDGLGVLRTFEEDAREAVADGRLVSLLADWCPSFSGPFLYYPSRRQPPPALAAFVAFATAWRRDRARRVHGS